MRPRLPANQQSEISNHKSPMSPAEFRALRIRSGLGPVAFARLLGVTYKALNHWERGHRKISQPVARLVRLLVPDKRISGARNPRKPHHVTLP